MILVIDVNSGKDSLASYEFVKPIASNATNHGEVQVAHYTEVTQKLLRNAEKVIITGTPLMETRYLQDIERFSWLRDFGSPVLGICAGMQIIAAVFGSRIIDCKEIGMTDVSKTADNELFDSALKAYCLHGKAVEPSREFVVLGRSRSCVQAIRHAKKPLYGILFHPETRNKAIIERFLGIQVKAEA